eukprot:10970743-Alexandrium_andersonii.AAC.1
MYGKAQYWRGNKNKKGGRGRPAKGLSCGQRVSMCEPAQSARRRPCSASASGRRGSHPSARRRC